ncbi:MAG: YihY family inner membrane protein [Chlorobiales bacterium]|nr:YihY family inner membrane protein [Chlorobiales bacterium]
MDVSYKGLKGFLAEKTANYVISSRSFLLFMWKNFMHDRVFLSAGSLAFQTLLSLVPLMAVVLSVLSISPAFENFQRYVEDFILQNFVPASGEVLKEYFLEFISKTSTVPAIGGVFLFVIALFLISTVDHTINQIWNVHAPRKILQGFTLYWTVLTLGPIIIGSGLVASSYVWYTVFTEGPLLEMRTRILSYLPLLNSFLAFFLLYMLVPNHRVRFLHAVSGAFLATVLFEMSKKWFSFYVTTFASFEHIYGALSVIPLLFFWIYLIWVVALSGAEFVYCLGAMRSVPRAKPGFRPLKGIRDVISVLEHIWTRQQTGEYVNLKKASIVGNGIKGRRLLDIVDALIESNFVHVTADGGLAISGNIQELTLYDLYRAVPQGVIGANGDGSGSEEYDASLSLLEERLQRCLQENMNEPLAVFLDRKDAIGDKG